MATTGKEVVQEWYDRVWNQSEEAAICELMDCDCKIDGLAVRKQGSEGFTEFYRGFQATFEDMHIEVMEMVEEDGRVFGHAKFTGKHIKSGNPVELIFATSATIQEGKIVEARDVVDFGSLMDQIGAVKLPNLAEAL